MLFAAAIVAAATFGTTVVNAQTSAGLTILAPGGPNLWWIADSDNNIDWTCATSPYPTFTVLVANTPNPSLLAEPLAVISIQNNFDCTFTLTKDQVTLPVGTGYTVQFASTLNRTDIYAESQPFEIKAAGATYPASSNTPQATGAAATSTSGASGSGSATGSGSASTPSATKSGAARTTATAGIGAFLGAIAFAALML